MSDAPRYRPIADYALVSDCHSTALVSCDGSIDWACLRRPDHGSAFARILDHDRGGYFSIRPAGEIVERSRRYVPSTMVLETTLTTATGTIVVTDGFVMREGGAHAVESELFRRIEATAGEVEVDVVIEPRFDYGDLPPWLRRDDGRITAVGGDDALVIDADRELTIERAPCRIVGR